MAAISFFMPTPGAFTLSFRTLAFAATAFGLAGCAQTSMDRTAPSSYAASAAGMPMGGSGAPMARMDEQMKTMQSMHDKMMQPVTPEQRSALMAEHMKVMQDSMAMMGGMMGKGGMGGMGATEGGMSMEMDRQMMEKHMQMMTDRMPPAPVKP